MALEKLSSLNEKFPVSLKIGMTVVTGVQSCLSVFCNGSAFRSLQWSNVNGRAHIPVSTLI